MKYLVGNKKVCIFVPINKYFLNDEENIFSFNSNSYFRSL